MGFLGRFKSSLLVAGVGIAWGALGHAQEGRLDRTAAAQQAARQAARSAGVAGLLAERAAALAEVGGIATEQRESLAQLTQGVDGPPDPGNVVASSAAGEDTLAAPQIEIATARALSADLGWPERTSHGIASVGRLSDRAAAERETARARLRAHLRELSGCFDGEARRHPGHSTDVRLRVVLDEDQPVKVILEERVVEEGLAACIDHVASGWQIAAPAHGRLVAHYRVSAHPDAPVATSAASPSLVASTR